jgi:hypothetical protein
MGSLRRGHAHGHEQIASIVEPMGVDQLCARLGPSRPGEEADHLTEEWCPRTRAESLETCLTLQYGSAALPAEQFGADVGPEPSPEEQHPERRPGGGLVVDATRRACIEIVEPTPPWHIARDAKLARIEPRPPLHPFKSRSLRGAAHSILPNYQDHARFGRYIAISRERLADEAFGSGAPEHAAKRISGELASYCTNDNVQDYTLTSRRPKEPVYAVVIIPSVQEVSGVTTYMVDKVNTHMIDSGNISSVRSLFRKLTRIAQVSESHGKLNKTPEWLPDQTPYKAKKTRRLSASPTDDQLPSPLR